MIVTFSTMTIMNRFKDDYEENNYSIALIIRMRQV